MHLYKVDTIDHDPVHVVARSDRQAAEIFISWFTARGEPPKQFTVECLPINRLVPQQQAQVRSAFALGLVGIAHFDQECGWTFSAPLWQPR